MTTPTHQPPPVDPEVIEMLASLQEPGEPDLVAELVSLFLRDTPERLRALQDRPLDPGHASRVAHAVKGSAGNLGATQLQDIASDLEQAGHRGDAADSLALLADALEEEFARVAAHLQALVGARASVADDVA